LLDQRQAGGAGHVLAERTAVSDGLTLRGSRRWCASLGPKSKFCSLGTDVARLYERWPHGTTQPSNSDLAQRVYGGRVRRLAVIAIMDNGYPRSELVLIKPTALAAQLGVSRSWLYEAAKTGRIPSIRIGGEEGPLRFVPEDIQRWLDDARANWVPGRSTRATRPAAELTLNPTRPRQRARR
jgi:predicted DNA-binding transcriptional regulator AlpA